MYIVSVRPQGVAPLWAGAHIVCTTDSPVVARIALVDYATTHGFSIEGDHGYTYVSNSVGGIERDMEISVHDTEFNPLRRSRD